MVEECVESIMSVPLADSERQVVVVDDGSRVDIGERLSLICPHIIYIKQENRGPGGARNTALAHATGTYVQFVDGDDALLPDAYSQCVEKLKSEEPDMLLFRSSHEKKTTTSPLAWHKMTTGARYMITHNLHATPCEYVFKRAILGSLRFPEGIFHEDEEFTPQLIARAATLCHTDGVAYYYRVRPNSTMNNHSPEFINKRLEYMPVIICRLRIVAGGMDDEAYEGMSRKVAQLTMDYIFNLMRLQRNWSKVRSAIAALRSCGLYPLPRRNYTPAYRLFALVANKRLGLILLYLLLPLVSHKDY